MGACFFGYPEVDPSIVFQMTEERVFPEDDVRRGQDRSLNVVTQTLVARFCLGPVFVNRCLDVITKNARIIRQVIKKGRHLGEKQGQVILDAGRCDAG